MEQNVIILIIVVILVLILIYRYNNSPKGVNDDSTDKQLAQLGKMNPKLTEEQKVKLIERIKKLKEAKKKLQQKLQQIQIQQTNPNFGSNPIIDYPSDYSYPFGPMPTPGDPLNDFGLGGDVYLGGGLYHHGGRNSWYN